jgi:hypothetical protein
MNVTVCGIVKVQLCIVHRHFDKRLTAVARPFKYWAPSTSTYWIPSASVLQIDGERGNRTYLTIAGEILLRRTETSYETNFRVTWDRECVGRGLNTSFAQVTDENVVRVIGSDFDISTRVELGREDGVVRGVAALSGNVEYTIGLRTGDQTPAV